MLKQSKETNILWKINYLYDLSNGIRQGFPQTHLQNVGIIQHAVNMQRNAIKSLTL